ncbi:MAG: DUF2815 family protein [Anaerolineae bacterium]|nr:DUF2815 family protein [Anaerolineae bacterium]
MTTATANTDPTIVMLQNVRLAFPQLFEPRVAPDTGRRTFGATFILPPDHPQIAQIHAAMDAAGRAKWADKWPAQKKALEKQDRLALHDGEIKAKYAGFEGNLYINASTSEDAPPTLVDGQCQPVTRSSGLLYPGCYVNVSLAFWAQKDHQAAGSRINARLRGVQFAGDGEPFTSGRPAAADEFKVISGAADVGDFA